MCCFIQNNIHYYKIPPLIAFILAFNSAKKAPAIIGQNNIIAHLKRY